MTDEKKFLNKIINSFIPNTPLRVKELVMTEEVYIIYASLYYGHEIPDWKSELLEYAQMKVAEYTSVPVIICRKLKDFEKIKLRYGFTSNLKIQKGIDE
jgi:hypothetical protein